MNLRRWTFGRILAVLGLAGGAVVTIPKVLPPTTHTAVVRVFEGPDVAADHKIPGAHVTLSGREIVADGAGNVAFDNLPGGTYEACAIAEGYKRACASASVPGAAFDLALERDIPPPPPPQTLVPLTTSGPVFLAGGQPWRWKGVSAFALLDRFAKGQDISDTLNAYRGFNVLRVWPYVPAKDWGARAWDRPSSDVVIAFLKRAEQAGFYVELTLLTDDDSARIEPARRLVDALKAARPPNLLLEAANEPITHKSIDTAALRNVLASSGFLYSSGDYEDSNRFYGSFLTAHTGRDGEWPRRAHDLLEYYQGGGPNAPSDPAHKVPIVADEPIRPDQAGFNAQDFRAYFGACALLGAGFTAHTETGKFGLPPTSDEARIVATALNVASAIAPDAPRGAYRRIDEGGMSLRTYVVGNYMVRIRPTTRQAPEQGWKPLDDDGILWTR